MKTLLQEIENTLEMSRDCWNRLDFAGLRQLWDPEEPEPTYLAEEALTPAFGWDEIEAYWDAAVTLNSEMQVEMHKLRVRPLSDDLATAMYELRWSCRFRNQPRRIGGDNRVTAIFRRRGGRWLFVQYVEAPLAPISYLRRFYERFGEDLPARG